MKIGLTIAGSDSGGGAGIQADIKAMQANGVFAASVLTAVTAQNTTAVMAAYDLPTDLIEAQLDAVFSDFDIAATKTGMLSSAAIIEVVSMKVRQHSIAPLVVDPVMISKSGFSLLKPDAVDALRLFLLPLATLVTPNAHEAGLLVGGTLKTEADAREAAEEITGMGAGAALVKGGHLEDEIDAVDVLFDGSEFHVFRSARIDTPNTHGTGCTYGAAIAANLAKGFSLVESIVRAKRYVTEAIRNGLAIGQGNGPTDHFYFLRDDDSFPYG
jgi:hydroxymethylpyrimidine/phosphomethylpyrimidine kinase